MTTTTKSTQLPKYHKSIQRWMNAAVKKMGSPDLVGSLLWKFNLRLTSTIGKARLTKASTVFSSLLKPPTVWYKPKVIEFSPALFERATASQRRWVVYHEVAHVVDACQGTFNPANVHGKSWQALMHKAGVVVRRCHDVKVDRRKRKKKV